MPSAIILETFRPLDGSWLHGVEASRVNSRIAWAQPRTAIELIDDCDLEPGDAPTLEVVLGEEAGPRQFLLSFAASGLAVATTPGQNKELRDILVLPAPPAAHLN